ncbi:MAG: DUF2975 domain-containing protein [Clostridia bacterium]|nr:DUF2975 domain-containing protein [Clostridia bacterium]
MKSKFLQTLVKLLIIIGMLCGLAVGILALTVLLPDAAQFFAEEQKPPAFSYIAGALAVLCVAGCEFIAITLFRMMCTLDRDPFVKENVRALRHMGWTALIVMALALATLLLHPLALAVLAAPPLGMCGLFSLVLSGVFEKAVAFKEENELTV